MPRKKHEKPSRRVNPTLSAEAYECLSWLAKEKRWGQDPNEVARYLITRELDDLTRANVLPDLKKE